MPCGARAGGGAGRWGAGGCPRARPPGRRRRQGSSTRPQAVPRGRCHYHRGTGGSQRDTVVPPEGYGPAPPTRWLLDFHPPSTHPPSHPPLTHTYPPSLPPLPALLPVYRPQGAGLDAGMDWSGSEGDLDSPRTPRGQGIPLVVPGAPKAAPLAPKLRLALAASCEAASYGSY